MMTRPRASWLDCASREIELEDDVPLSQALSEQVLEATLDTFTIVTHLPYGELPMNQKMSYMRLKRRVSKAAKDGEYQNATQCSLPNASW